MDLWDISKDVFDNLIKDISAKAAEDEEDNTSAAKENILDVLPPELLEHIFQFLPQSDLLTLRLVCKEFNEAATSPQVFQMYLQERYLDIKELDVEVMHPLLKNIKGVNIYNTREEEAEDIGKFFKKLEDQFTSLKILKISYGCIPANISLENIVERLSELVLSSVDFKNPPHFFRTTPENPVYRNLEIFRIYSCTGISDEAPFEGLSVAPMRHLRELSLNDVQVLSDRDYLHLKDSMVNVTELTLSNTMLNLETFQQLDLKKLTNLNVTQSQSSEDWLSALKNFHELEILYISGVSITDRCSAVTFKKLNKIKSLSVLDCNFGNRTVSAIGSHLPNLVTWEMMQTEDGNVTDTALINLAVHEHLETIMFDRVQFGGFSFRQIAHCAPALKYLTLTVCAAGDDDMDVFKDCFKQLKKLVVSGLRITDTCIAKLEPKLGSLEEIQIESRLMTGAGVAQMLPFLTSSICTDIKFGEPQSSFSYSRCNDDSYNQLALCGPAITKEMMMALTKELYNATVLRYENLSLVAADVRHFVETQPRVDALTINNCTIDEEALVFFLRDFLNLTTLNIYQCHLTDTAIVKLFEGIGSRGINQVMIENDTMLSEETLLTIVPISATVREVNIHTMDYLQYLSINNCAELKDVTFQGMAQLTDDTFVKIMKSYYELVSLTITDTSITVKSIAEIAEHLTQLSYLRIKSKVMGDEMMEIIGGHFPSLKNLSLEGECVTDVGLVALGKHLESLESLIVVHSGITDEGVKKIAPLLKCATALDLYSGNKKVTPELLAYMRETYPDIRHTEPETEEVAEGENGEAEEPVQAEEGNEAAADPVQIEGQNEVAADPVEPEGGNEVVPEAAILEEGNLVAADPAQSEAENELAAEPVEREERNEVATDSPQNEDDIKLQKTEQENIVVEERIQSARKNSANVEQQSPEGQNGVDTNLPIPERYNGTAVDNGQPDKQNGVDEDPEP